MIESISREEREVIGADFNGHVGERKTGYDEVIRMRWACLVSRKGTWKDRW